MRARAVRPYLQLAALTVLAGCAGWPSSVDDSGLPPHQVGGYCVGGSSDVSVIQAAAGVLIEVRPAKDKLNGSILLDLNFLVPEGVTLRLKPPALTLASPDWPQGKRLPIDHFTDRGGRRIPAGAALTGSPGWPPAAFTAWFFPDTVTELAQTGLRQVREFTLSLPPLEIDGAEFGPGPVTFRAYRKWGLFGCIA